MRALQRARLEAATHLMLTTASLLRWQAALEALRLTTRRGRDARRDPSGLDQPEGRVRGRCAPPRPRSPLAAPRHPASARLGRHLSQPLGGLVGLRRAPFEVPHAHTARPQTPQSANLTSDLDPLSQLPHFDLSRPATSERDRPLCGASSRRSSWGRSSSQARADCPTLVA